MNLTGRNTGKVRANRVQGIRAFALLLPTLLAWLLPSFANAAIVHEGTFTADSGGLSAGNITVNNVSAGTDQLYLISVALYGTNMTVSSVSGGSMTWTLQRSQCSARISQPQVEIWQAFGSPGASFNVTATLSGTADVVSAAVSRYSGTDTSTPTEAVNGSNSNGLNGACTGGTDNTALSLSLTSTVNDSVLYVASHFRNKTLTTPDAAYTQRALITNSVSGDGANMAVHDRSLASAGSDSADHTISSAGDWDMAGLVIRPAGGAGSCPIDVSIAASSDDAEEPAGGGTVDLTSSDLELIADGGDQEVGMRFLNLDIPQGATIDNAYITFYSKNTTTAGTPDLTFYAEDADSAVTFSNTAPDKVTTRTKTTASVTWNSVPAWSTADTAQQTPDLKSIIQEVVNRGGWSQPNNDIAIIVTGTTGALRRAWSFDGTGTAAALHVECSPAAPTYAVTSAVAEISPNDVTTSSTGNSFSYDIQATIGGGDSGVNRVEITVPVSFGAPTVTDVQDDGVSVAYTNNTSGNAISVDLTTKITASSKITVLFSSDAPTTQDLTGVDFTSTVDDSATGDAAQATTEGNGDGDAGDANSWTVTTTDPPLAATSAVAEISPNNVTTSSTGNAFSYDIQATIGGSDTGVNRVAITVPGSFGAPTVTDVQDDGVSVAYTNNTSGNAISVDLTTKITATSKITVLFSSDAPTTQDLAGVNFTSTVDDSGTGAAAQSTSEGNGDGDVWDNNSWTVTTTNAAGGSCLIDTFIAVENDDAEESSSGSMDLSSSDLELVEESSKQTVGLRFTGLAIAQGATITNAYVEFTAQEAPSTVASSLTFHAQDIDDAPIFSNTSNNISGRTTTTQSVTWNPVPDWTTNGAQYQSPDISSVVEAVVGRTGWVAGNDIAIIITGTAGSKRVADAHGTGTNVKLHVECTAAANAVTSAVAEISPNDVTTSSTGNSFTYDIQATIGGSDTGVDTVEVTVPGTFGAPTVTDVLDDDVSVAYTNNTSGNTISVDITTKITATSKITVLFDADAPTTADATGVDFTSTVDDSGTGDAAQATTEGNGDGDAGDANSWTVTTTDGATGPIAHWTFDEGTGQTAADSSGNGYNGTLGSSAGADASDPNWVCVAGGYALSFDGTDDVVDAASPAGLDDLGPMTVTAWIKPDSSGAAALQHVVSKTNASNGTGRWFVELDNTGEDDALEFNKEYDTTDVQRVSNNSTVTYDVWQHVTATWDGSSTGTNIHIYKDGVEAGYQTTSNGSVSPQADAALLLMIGNRADGTYPFWGLIDEVRVYDRVLSGVEISALAASAPVDCLPAVTSAVAEISPNDVTTSSTANSFSYDIQATISGSDTGVNRVAITVPGTFGAPTVTGVQVGGSGVAYTDNTAGNAISVDLTAKVTTSSKITVLFDADAPTTEDLVGVDFTSTVDDSGNSYAAQATTEGNGDGDAGDSNSWTVTTTDASSSPLSYWPLDETSGTTAADILASHDGTYTNSPTLNQAGACANTGTGVYFNGETGGKYVVVSHHDDYLIDSGTISLWANFDEFPNPGTDAEHVVFSKDSNGFDTGGHVDMRILTDGSVEVRLQSATTSYLVNGATLTATNWHHIAFSWGAGGMKLYVDGAAPVTDPYTGGLGTTSGGIGNYEPITFAASQFNSNPDLGVTPLTRFMKGYLDDVRIYDSPLSIAEIQALANCDPAPAVTSAVAEITPNDVITSSTGNSFTYDIQATIGGSDTGVNRVEITVPGTFGAPTVTDVLDDDVSVAYTNNTSGNTISVDLTTKITASSKITVLFNADAPTTADATGVDFTSTVDDWATGDAAQATTEGNGDADAGDNNSWTVTTTDDVVSGLIGHWKFNDGSGQTAADSSATNNDGTLGTSAGADSADPNWVCSGTALEFDGSNDEVQLGATTINDRAAFTINAWIKMSADTADQRTIYSEGNTAQTEYLFMYVDDSTNTARFYMVDPSSNFGILQGSSNVEDDQWHMITVVQRSKTDRELYVDGTSEDTDTNNAGTYTFNTSSVGFLRTDWTADPFLGTVDDVRIYDRALTTGEISTLAGSPPSCGAAQAVTSAVAEISPNDVITSATANSFGYDIQATIGGGDTGVNRVAITVPGSFGAPTVTDVLVDGSSVAYTDNTSGNAISVDLTTKVTASSKITVQFDANSPTSADATGVDFTSTVDDSGTGDAAQATTEGNGDGDAADNDSWTVTTTDGGTAVLLVVLDKTTPTAQDAAKKSLIETWGYTVTMIEATESQAAFDAAVTTSDVAYISEEITSTDLDTKLLGACIGVVDDEDALTDEFGISTTNTNYSSSTIDITNSSHYITSPFSVGSLTITSSAQPLHIASGTVAAGAQLLAEQPATANGTLVVLDAGATLTSPPGGTAAGRRVYLPWAGGAFDINTLTNDGKLLMRRALEWGTSGADCNLAVTSAVAEISPNDVTTSSTGNSFSYDIQATISGGDTGVNRVAITVPAGFSSVSVTGVQVDGGGVAYTDNTVGNAISVDLTVKVTASSKITILFDADAPTSEDLTGVDFTSTVDDSGTGDAAQSTTEGNGDGDSGDNNSWTVTTTDAAVAVSNAVAEINPNNVQTSSTGNSFSYDIQATISGSDTGVNRVAITVPGTFGAPTVTGVQVNSTGVAYTDNTAGNTISVDLTTKVTATTKITILFDADAPTTEDLTGVAFTSTVDDSGTGQAAQATSQGNGDGDAGDNNSWVVTTSDIAGLVAHWDFDEGSGQTAADATGNGHTATLGTSGSSDSADPAWECVGNGYGLDFDGVNDIVYAGSGAALDDLEPFTIMAWVKPDSSDVGGVSQVIARGTGNGRWFIERDNTSPETHAYEFNKEYDSSDLMRVTSNNTVSYDVWQHVAATWDGSDFASNVHIYKNGVETGYQTTNNGSTTKQSDAAIDLVFGNREDGSQGFTGLMDEVRIYDRVLSAGEIAALAAATPGSCANNAVSAAVAEISPNNVTTSATGNSFEYDIQATIGGSNTGVNRVAITVPVSFGAPTVTDVKVAGASIAFTDNTVGNAISVDLTTKVTASSKITVLFDADAPTTQDLTGVNFLSTVDDSGTGDAAQNTTEGNGDGDAGDNNSWTVTTTNSGGGACIAVDGTASTGSTETSTLQISHTTSGSDRLMLVGISFDNNQNETVSSVTYNSIALTFVGADELDNDARVEIWQLTENDGLPTGTHNVDITFSADLNQPAIAGVMTFTGVDQTTPLGTFASNTGTSNAASVNVGSAVSELVYAIMSGETVTSVTTDAPASEHWNLNAVGSLITEYAAGATDDGAATVNMSWSLGSIDYWAAGGVSIKPSGSCNSAVTSAAAEISPNDVATSSTGNSFSYDIYATISGGDTGVNVISITVPGSFGVPTVTDVLVNSVSVPYTDNTSGNAISVVLTTKVAVSNRLTVLFDADAPTTQDLTGVDFVSTVDDNGSSDSPQATTEGNGDNDAGDSNSWTVTTTDGGGGGADPVVNSTGDASDNNAGNGVCDTGGLNSQSNTECTLRAAIQEANASAGLDTITFNMPTTESGYNASPLSYTINPGSTLPTITDLVVIDGTSQSGFPGTPIVVLDGNDLGAVGLTLGGAADGSTIRGLVIRDFGDNGLEIQAGSDGNLIAGNYIGRLNVSGTDAGAGEENAVRGIEVLADNNTIGGTTAADRNVISGNGGEGIIIRSGASGTIVQGNYLGTEADGTTALGNDDEAIQIDTASPGTIIGGSAAGAGNVIGANGISSGAAISIGGDGSDNTVVQGNFIGTDASGTVDIGNIRSGVEVRGSDNAATSPLNTLIGGTGAGEGNIIRYNDLDGVRIRNVAVDVAILGNSIYDSSQQGIDLWAAASNDNVTSNDSGDGDSGANYLMNYPVITLAIEDAGNVDVEFDLDVTAGNYRVEFFKNPAGADPSGNGEGQTYVDYVDIAHGGTGSESFATSFSGALGDVLSATATEIISGPAFRNTSEFSATYTVTAGTAVAAAEAEISPNDVATAGGTYLFEYDIAATIGAANTGVDRVAITVPGAFGVSGSPVVNVLVDGVTVAFTDNTVGNAISVDLTTKVTTNARITVVFDAIAPSTQDLVGVDFTSTVDDSATGDAAQAATEGEGDGDTEDNNSWTVTTTGAGGGGGGSCTALDGSPSNLVQAGGGSLTISHTTSGADRLMVVGVSIALGSGESVSSVTYNGDALTFQGSAQGPGNDSRVEIWTRVAPDVGTFNVVVNLSASTHDGASAGVATFTGVDQATPLGAFASDSGTGGSASFNVSSAVGDLVFGVVAVDDGTNYNLVPGGGQSEHWDLDTDELNASGTTEDGAASVTTSWTWSGSDDFAAGGISVKAAGGGCDTAVTSAAAEISPNDVITSSTGNTFAYDIQTTVNAGDTGVDRVAITVPGTFGAPTVTDVLVDGVSVSHTDNTSGNDISVDLTTKVTYSARITVLFTSDAPTTQDLTGKDFLSTVDDTGDATAPQSTTEGNGDGDAGDNNDWTVTTTDSGGASCIVDSAGTYIEAENYTALVAGADTGTFTVESSQAGYNGTGYLISNNGDTGSPPDDMRADYTVEFTTTGTYYIWIRGYALDSGSDSVWIGLDGTEVGALNENGNYNQWIWTDSIQSGVNTINIPTAGWYTLNLWVRESNHKVDGIYITQDSGAIPGGPSIDIPTPGGSGGTFTKRVIASTDDAEQRASSAWDMDLTSSDLELHNSGGDGYVGMRWTGVTIPQGATIDDARIQFHVDEIAVPESSEALTVTFRGEDADNAGTFTSTASDISDRTETTASVDWAIATWVAVNDEGAAQLTSDLSPIVQEIVDRGSWSSGNAMVIMIKAWSGTGRRTAESENGEDTAAAELQIDYTTGGSQATIIDPSNCGAGGGIAHFAISHDGTGINCQAENITIEAHDSGHSVVTTYAGTLVLSTSTNHGDWSVVTGSGSLTSGARGNAVYGYSAADSGSVVLGLRDTFVETTNIDVNAGGMNEHSTEDPDLVFARSGFNFLADSAKNTIGIQIAGKPSNVAPGVQTLELQAIKTNDDTGQCEAALVGATTIDIGFECEDPDTCATNSLTFGGISVPANDNAAVPTYARVSMDFGSSADDTATFTMQYNDVGKVKLYARNRLLPSGEEMLGGSNSFVVRPFAFDMTISGNPAATGPSDPVFVAAGEEFTADVTALLWEAGDDTDNDGIPDNHDDTDPSNNADLSDNAAAPNYGYETAIEQVLLTAALDQPAGGANPGLAGGTSVTVFTAGTGTTDTVRYDEVGIIEISAKVSDNDYLGIGSAETAKITSKSGYVGRFNPAQYDVTAGDINPACSATFTYARQPFTGSMTIEAQNAAAAGNTRTENYRGAFVTLDPNAELVFINSATTTAYNSQSVTYNQDFNSGNFGEAILALQFRWDMGEQVPTTSTVQNTGVTDEVNTLASAPVSIGSSPTRFGRAVIGTAAGSELVDLGVVMRTEYYLDSTSGYVVNTDDFCSMGATMSISNFADNLDAGETCVQDSGNPGLSGAGCTVAGPILERYDDPLLAGNANLWLRAPGAGNDGSATVSADVPGWLEFDWDAGVGGLEDPSGHIVFGIYGGDKNQVYRRELY